MKFLMNATSEIDETLPQPFLPLVSAALNTSFWGMNVVKELCSETTDLIQCQDVVPLALEN